MNMLAFFKSLLSEIREMVTNLKSGFKLSFMKISPKACFRVLANFSRR